MIGDTFKLVDVGGRFWVADLEGFLVETLLVLDESAAAGVDLFEFEAGFSIEVFGFDIGDALRVRGGEEEDICGDVLVLHDFDEVSDF